MREFVVKPYKVHALVITRVRCICMNSLYEITLEDGHTRFYSPCAVGRNPVEGGYYVVDAKNELAYTCKKDFFEDGHNEVLKERPDMESVGGK